MNGFVADPLWNRPAISYTLFALADAATQAAIAPVTAALAVAAGGAAPLHLPPPDTLHLSLYSMAPVRSNFDKDAFWTTIAAVSRATLEQWCADHAPFTLRFTALRAMPAAVIAVAEPAEPVWDLRRRMAAGVPPPPGGVNTYDLIHITVARYAQPDRLPADFAARVAAIPLDLPFAVRAISLMRETVYPALAFETLDSVPLRAMEPVS